jgi:hypothetical protein
MVMFASRHSNGVYPGSRREAPAESDPAAAIRRPKNSSWTRCIKNAEFRIGEAKLPVGRVGLRVSSGPVDP